MSPHVDHKLTGFLGRSALIVLALLALEARVCADDPPSPFRVVKPPDASTDRGPTKVLETLWPGYPEALAEFAEILGGRQLESGRGWYRKGVSRTRFDWTSVTEALDRDHDGKVTLAEFAGKDFDFKRLDRDQNGRLTSADLEFPANELAMSRSKMVFSFADRDGNGKLTRDECDRMVFMAVRDAFTRARYFSDAIETVVERIKESEREGFNFLSLSDLQETIDRMAIVKNLPQPPDPNSDLTTTSTPILLRSFFRRELGALTAGPELNAIAPDFTLPTDNARVQVTLSKLVGSKPVVLVFGNYSAPSFRAEAGNLEKLYRRYRDRAHFLMVYVRESHPSDGWRLVSNDQKGIRFAQPRDNRERAEVARLFQTRLELTMPLVVDGVDDRVGMLYSGIPSRLYLVDRQGRIAYKGGRGPFGFKPAELEQALLLLLRLP